MQYRVRSRLLGAHFFGGLSPMLYTARTRPCKGCLGVGGANLPPPREGSFASSFMQPAGRRFYEDVKRAMLFTINQTTTSFSQHFTETLYHIIHSVGTLRLEKLFYLRLTYFEISWSFLFLKFCGTSAGTSKTGTTTRWDIYVFR